MYAPAKIRSAPGIKRDGTVLEGDNYIDGRWVRFQRGLPRKIGGCVSVAQVPERVYGINSFSANARQYLHLGSASLLSQRALSNVGTLVGTADRTPAGLVASEKNIWQMDVIFDIPSEDASVVVAHAAPNMDIDSTQDADIYYGVVTDSGALVASGQDPVSGGVVVVGNHLVGFGSGGYVQWSAANDVVGATADASYVTQQKIIAGRRVRGGGVPAALLWSLDSVIQMTYTGATSGPLWRFDTITEESSILSSRGPIEYDGVWYWPGVDRFMSYTGVVREVQNNTNVNFFFDNLNFAQRQKVFAYKVPRFGEIWWCFPLGDSEECNHAIILNVREGTWYDTPLLGEGRTDGIYAKVYFKPFMTGAEETVNGHDVWQHETGVDEVRGNQAEPIVSYFETGEISLLTQEQGAVDRALSVCVIEPDFVQLGELRCTVRGRANARAPYTVSAEKIIPATASDAEQQVVRLKEHRRLMSFRFESNTLGGDYQMGEPIAHIQPSDGRITQ